MHSSLRIFRIHAGFNGDYHESVKENSGCPRISTSRRCLGDATNVTELPPTTGQQSVQVPESCMTGLDLEVASSQPAVVLVVTSYQRQVFYRWLVALSFGYLESTVWAPFQCGFPGAREEIVAGRQLVCVNQDGIEPSICDHNSNDSEQDG